MRHGLHKTPEYHVWADIKQRCNNPKAPEYPNYGGRGIKMCDEWQRSYASFYFDLGPRPSRKYEIDRMNNDGDYSPANCRWATRLEQTLNMRRNVILKFNGLTMPLSEWAKKLKIKDVTLRARISKMRWTVQKALTTPVNTRDL